MNSQNCPQNALTEETLLSLKLEQLSDVLDLLDTLHTAASEGDEATFAHLDAREMMSYLQDIIYVAQQTINEIETNKRTQTQPRQSFLRLVEKQEKKKIG